MNRIVKLAAPWILGSLAFQLALLGLLAVSQRARADDPSDECAMLWGYGTDNYNNCVAAYDYGCSQCMAYSGDDYNTCITACFSGQCPDGLPGGCASPGLICYFFGSPSTCKPTSSGAACYCPP